MTIDVHLKDKSIWLSQKQIAELFGSERSVVTKHVIKDHPFSDGNKRIGSFLFILFLRINNLLAGGADG